MTLTEFKRALSKPKPPAGATPALAALWWAAKDDWSKAHALVMDQDGKDCARVHAYLHRVEGDRDNAEYWYRQAGKPAAAGSLDVEWMAIAEDLLSRGDGG